MTLVEMDRPTRDGRGKDSALRDWVRALEATAPIAGQPQRLLLEAIETIAQSRGDAPALIAEHDTLTYRALVERSRRYARWALGQKLGKGQTVCLMMPNRPDYMAAGSASPRSAASCRSSTPNCAARRWRTASTSSRRRM